MCVNIAMNAFH